SFFQFVEQPIEGLLQFLGRFVRALGNLPANADYQVGPEWLLRLARPGVGSGLWLLGILGMHSKRLPPAAGPGDRTCRTTGTLCIHWSSSPVRCARDAGAVRTDRLILRQWAIGNQPIGRSGQENSAKVTMGPGGRSGTVQLPSPHRPTLTLSSSLGTRL